MYTGPRMTHEEILALTPETIQAIPDALLAGLLKRLCTSFRGAMPENVAQREMVVAEARRRGPTRIWCWWYVQQLDPDRCACGGPGHYIVGSTTYCSKCRPRAVAQLTATSRSMREPRGTIAEQIYDDYDRAKRRAAQLRIGKDTRVTDRNRRRR